MTEKERGVKAIIGLQVLAGIAETPEQAGHGWDHMSASERATTLQVAENILPGDWDNDDS